MAMGFRQILNNVVPVLMQIRCNRYSLKSAGEKKYYLVSVFVDHSKVPLAVFP